MKTFKDKPLNNNKWQKILLLLFTIFLSACQLSYTPEQQYNLQIEYVLIDAGFDETRENFNKLDFKPFDQEYLVPFDSKTNLLLKVKIPINTAQTSVKEFTMSVFPNYFDEVQYLQRTSPIDTFHTLTQPRIQLTADRPYSSYRFAFNIDDADIPKEHYFLIKAKAQRYVNLQLFDTLVYSRIDSQHSHFFTLIYSLIFGMAALSAIFYVYNRETTYLLYSLYMLTSLQMLLWVGGKINDLPFLAWQIIGSHSSMFFIFLNTLAATAFFYHFMQLKAKESLLVKALIIVVGLQTILIGYALIGYHFLGGFNYKQSAALLNLTTLIISLIIFTIIIIKTIQKDQQAHYLVWAWGIMIISALLRIYFAFNLHPDLYWLAQSYEIAVMIEGLILTSAIGNRYMEFKKQRDQAVNKYSKAEQSIFEHQLLNQFNSEMLKLTKDLKLSTQEVAEKTKIKFHLLLTRAFPIKNSLVLEGEQIKDICTTGIDDSDIDFLKRKAIDLLQNQQKRAVEQKLINMSGDKQNEVLFIPLKDKNHRDVIFILTLKNNEPIKLETLRQLQKFCGLAYIELLQAEEVYKVTLAANRDSLTQCYNRSSVEKIIQHSLNQKKITTIAFIDLDNLKNINDKYGHQTGDQCIIEFAHLMEEIFYPAGKVGRMGGDEFLVVFSGLDFNACMEHIESFMESLASLRPTDHKLTLACSLGVAESRMNETTRSLIKKADKALYHSKEQGRNRFTVYESTLT